MAPATDPAMQPALLIVSHGSPSEPEPQEEAMRVLGRAVAKHLPGWRVEGTTLAAEGCFEAAVARLGKPVVYPFFMSEGWFTNTFLARKTADLGLRQVEPFGIDPALPSCAVAEIKAVLRDKGWASQDTALLLAAHGSGRSKTSADAPRAFARTLEAAIPFREVATGFVEQEPFLVDAARDLGQALCLSFFALRSGHVEGDLPEAFAEAGFAGPVLPPFIEWEEVPELIARGILRQRYASEAVMS
ncbi:cobalamin biosynthesis protein CbiX [Rhodalgimonas zhirmunskyi]|uniref:Cobalamin biosynthesis protein CbiX n=1 Tax=Rhodalgimonas zhirmunskyi TaxID=2964767 RepID=A0AAJ1X6Y0_9RHOB|nr:cobalamin biosynthesis protein CbiX [Rhodoalgimonas zhirmunskyi]MDQ2095139.1 cobalamin biosynthesis protein CbiX [Rhodoalgimonas zhirmunskyi]